MNKPTLAAFTVTLSLLSAHAFALTCFTLDQKIGPSDSICIDQQELDFHQSYVLITASKYHETTSVKIDDRAGLKNIAGAPDLSNSTATAIVFPFKTMPVQIAISGDSFQMIVSPGRSPIVVTAHGKFMGIANVGGARPVGGMGIQHKGMFELLGATPVPEHAPLK